MVLDFISTNEYKEWEEKRSQNIPTSESEFESLVQVAQSCRSVNMVYDEPLTYNNQCGAEIFTLEEYKTLAKAISLSRHVQHIKVDKKVPVNAILEMLRINPMIQSIDLTDECFEKLIQHAVEDPGIIKSPGGIWGTMNVRSIALTLYNTAPILFDHLPLNLHSFSLLYKKFTNEGCQKLSNFLKSSMDLKRVSIHQYASIDDTCDCSTESLEMLQNAFVDHTNLIEMSFRLNYFDDSSYEKLSTLIQRNRQLTRLNIVDRERTSNPYLATLMEVITQHPTLVHLSIFGSDQTLPYIYKLIKENKVLKSIRFLFINNPINYNLTMSDCSPLPESLAINTTLNTLDIQFHPIVYQSLYLSMKSILANNPGFKRNTFVSEGWSLLSRSKYNLFNEIAVRLVTYRPLLILLSTSITNDITSHIFSHYTCTFELDERLLNKVLLDRVTIGKLINREVTYSHGKFNAISPSFDYSELIRACARLSIA